MHDHTAIDNQPLLIMLGLLGAAFGTEVNFWQGSNKGSGRAKELLPARNRSNFTDHGIRIRICR